MQAQAALYKKPRHCHMSCTRARIHGWTLRAPRVSYAEAHFPPHLDLQKWCSLAALLMQRRGVERDGQRCSSAGAGGPAGHAAVASGGHGGGRHPEPHVLRRHPQRWRCVICPESMSRVVSNVTMACPPTWVRVADGVQAYSIVLRSPHVALACLFSLLPLLSLCLGTVLS